jgi:Bax protein
MLMTSGRLGTTTTAMFGIIARAAGRSTTLFVALLGLYSSLDVGYAQAAPPYALTTAERITPDTSAGLRAFFQALDYRWLQFDDGVTPFILERIPQDISRNRSVKLKKQTFFMGLLPMVLLANREIEREREELLAILERRQNRATRAGDRERIREIARRYRLRGHPLTDHRVRERLLRRVDIIPPSLVLAQAANESAWGTSRFARQGNNLFGEWTFTPGTGIVPKGRPAGATYEVRRFPSLYQSIRSYMNNLNSNGAYRKLRRIRERLRRSGSEISGVTLAVGLHKYSQRGADYISELRAMIRHNKLAAVDNAVLRSQESEALTSISTEGAGFFSSRNRMIGRLAARNP